MFYYSSMGNGSAEVASAVASLRQRWGAAAPVIGALAALPEAFPTPSGLPEPVEDARVVRTGFPELDAILGPGGVPRQASLAVLGDHSSGKTTLALRLAAEAQAAGGIVGYVDLARSLDPVEAVARGIQLEWLVVLTPADLDEGLAMAGALLQARAVDVLLIDLPPERRASPEHGTSPERTPSVEPTPSAGPRARDRPGVPERLHRLAALARRAETLLVVLEPPGLAARTAEAVAEASGLRLELARRSWIHLGRDVVGQRTEVVVARNRFGPPGRRAELRILYAEGGERDGCLSREELLVEAATGYRTHDQPTTGHPISAPTNDTGTFDDATPPPLLAPPAAPTGPIPLRILGGKRAGRRTRGFDLSGRTDRPRRAALDGGVGDRRQPGSRSTRRSTGDGARQRTPAGA
ncbi:MAG: hypothetical protein E6I45_08220 [Chloroflexi bacterium]|nr:MAG: hypothetical protein E6I45_08220 [Chloroflexota bacterium]